MHSNQSLQRSATHHGERGFALVIVAVLALVILGFVGLAIDSAHVENAAQQLQTAADSAALAAAGKLSDESSALGGSYPLTRAAAVTMASQNSAVGAAVAVDANAGNGSAGDVVVGLWDKTTKAFVPSTVSPNAVKVVARRTDGSTGGSLSLVFGGLFGAATGDVSRTSIATYSSASNPRIIVLDPSGAGALSMGGTTLLDAVGGSIQVNSSNACGIKLTGTSQLVSDGTNVHGHACVGGSSNVTNLNESTDVLADPLASILPTVGDWTTLRTGMSKPAGATGKISGTGSFAPGYYPKGLDVASGASVTLSSGTFMFGTTFSLNGTSVVTGAHVTILLDQDVTLTIGGGGSLILTPPSSGAFEGLTLMAHRSTTGAKVLLLGGNGVLSCEGTLYVPSGEINLSGTGGAQSFGQLVSSTLTASGTSDITGLHIVPGTEGGGSVFLVH